MSLDASPLKPRFIVLDRVSDNEAEAPLFLSEEVEVEVREEEEGKKGLKEMGLGLG